MQRHRPHFVATGSLGAADLRKQVPLDRIRHRQHVVPAIGVDQRGAVPAQQQFEDRHQLFARHRLGGRESHLAADAGRNDEGLLQHFAQDGVHHRLDRLALEIQHDLAVLGHRRGRPWAACLVDELAGTLVNFQIRDTGIGRDGGLDNGFVRRQWSRCGLDGLAGAGRAHRRAAERGAAGQQQHRKQDAQLPHRIIPFIDHRHSLSAFGFTPIIDWMAVW